MCATTYKGVVFHHVGLLSLEWEPSKSSQALTCQPMNWIICGYLTNVYQYTIPPTPPTPLQHLPTSPPPPPPPPPPSSLVRMVYAQCVIPKDLIYEICNILLLFALSYAVSCNGSKQSNYKGTQCFCSYQWAILTIQFVTSPFN